MATNTTKTTSIQNRGLSRSSSGCSPSWTCPICGVGGQLKREGEVELTSVFSPIQLGKTAAMAARPAERSDP